MADSRSEASVMVCVMTLRFLLLVRPARSLPILATLISLLFPLDSSALVRQNPTSGSFFAPEWETCRNDPVNNSDPLGLETVDEQITALEQRNQQYIQKVSRAAKITEAALNTAVDVSPVGNVIAITQGTDASGERLSWWEKGLVAIPALATLRNANKARKTVREINALSKISSDAKFVFWGGRWKGAISLNEKAARDFAADTGGTLLDMTAAGRDLSCSLDTTKMTIPEIRAAWSQLSLEYARSAAGEVHAFTGGAAVDSVWKTVELPALLQNPRVTKIIIHDAARPEVTRIIYPR